MNKEIYDGRIKEIEFRIKKFKELFDIIKEKIK